MPHGASGLEPFKRMDVANIYWRLSLTVSRLRPATATRKRAASDRAILTFTGRTAPASHYGQNPRHVTSRRRCPDLT